MARRVKHTVRFSEEEQVQLRRAAKERGYLNPTTFIRAALRNEVAGRGIEITSSEQRIAATLERFAAGSLSHEQRPAGSFRRPRHAGKASPTALVSMSPNCADDQVLPLLSEGPFNAR
jgi:hypothetical protein